MSWVRIDDCFPDHPKCLKLGSIAKWLWVSGLCYCQRLKTDGRIPKEVVTKLIPSKDKPRLAAESLVKARLWERDANGDYIVHNYLKHNLSAEQRLEKANANRERQTRYRTRNNASRNALVDRISNEAPLLSSPSPTSVQRDSRAHNALQALNTKHRPGIGTVPNTNADIDESEALLRSLGETTR